MKPRNLQYEQKFRAYLFSGGFERHKEICKNINVKPIRNGDEKMVNTQQLKCPYCNSPNYTFEGNKDLWVCDDCGESE